MTTSWRQITSHKKLVITKMAL